MRRRAPRSLSASLEGLLNRIAPAGTLIEVQRAWASAVGPGIAQHAHPTQERSGILTIACDSAVWAQEIELMGPELAAKLNGALGRDAVQGLRCRATGGPAASVAAAEPPPRRY